MSSLKNIVWIGTGRISLPILEKVLATGGFNIKLLVRNPISAYPSLPSGLSSVHQVDYADHKSLVQHLRGQDAVLVFTSFVPGNGLDTKQIALVNAAIDAGVKYFIPSEWALDTGGIMGNASDKHGPTLPTDMVLAPKRVTHNYLLCRAAEGKIRFAVVYPGVMFELGFQTGMFNFDFAARTACLPDNGINPFPASTLSTLSKVIISLFTNPYLISNRFYHIADGVLTQQDVFQVIEKESGVPWTRTSYSTWGLRNSALENMQRGIYGPKEHVESLATPFFGGLQVFTKVDNEGLGVRFGDIDLREEVVRLARQQLLEIENQSNESNEDHDGNRAEDAKDTDPAFSLPSGLWLHLYEAIFQLSMMFWTYQELTGDMSASAIIHFTAALGIHGSSFAFHSAHASSSRLAALVLIGRLLFLEYAVPVYAYNTLDLAWPSFAKSIVKREGVPGNLAWAPDGRSFTIGDDKTVRLSEFCEIHHKAVKAVQEQVGEMLLGWEPDVDVSVIRDDLTCRKAGWSFIDKIENNLVDIWKTLLHRLQKSSFRGTTFTKSGYWNAETCHKYLSAGVELNKSILAAIHFRAGLPGRGTEGSDKYGVPQPVLSKDFLARRAGKSLPTVTNVFLPVRRTASFVGFCGRNPWATLSHIANFEAGSKPFSVNKEITSHWVNAGLPGSSSIIQNYLPSSESARKLPD
ncbi:uncharacterized protein FRV6_16532 [Fusarium oxysporum]|uniref:NmrA-like domain-containing protein n=1 Tax=Fusarium oxysporum TaxID=5507 RepID=A0A2H3TUW2_FUSOX|nr:uncharacterized protein FRV6_16532 [Fusarium oxysporum]